MTPDRPDEALTDPKANEAPLAWVRFGDHPGDNRLSREIRLRMGQRATGNQKADRATLHPLSPLMDPTPLVNLIAQDAGGLERHHAARRDRGRDSRLGITAGAFLLRVYVERAE
jgi:hypothetical protein